MRRSDWLYIAAVTPIVAAGLLFHAGYGLYKALRRARTALKEIKDACG